ncbi:MAG: hypothetical protein IKC26_02200 [Clostridia bacterium]|nr:hypothetical protein [Clostridia bacterium]
MKKKLNEIFDEAKPQELDQFSNELDAPELPDEVLASVKGKVYAKTNLKKEKKTNKNVWLRFGTIAACLVLIVSAVFAMPRLWKDEPGVVTPPDDTNRSPVIFDATVSPEKLNGSNLEFIVGSSASLGGAVSQAPPAFEFPTGIFAVKARVVKNHPDLYYKLDVISDSKPTAYRLIQMETLEVIHGENVPQYFLYLIRNSYYVDMSVYDSLIIAMGQLGAENYVLKNQTKSQMEAFDLPVFADYQDRPDLGSIIAFSDGVFDEGLWQTRSWTALSYINWLPRNYPVVTLEDSEDTVIAAIKHKIDEDKEWLGDRYKVPSPWTLNFSTEKAKAAIAYVKPFVNGVFSQYRDPYYPGTSVVFRRYINGCQTEETVTIDLLTEEVTYSEVRYTKEDMEQMENISIYLSEKAKEYEKQTPIPPHTDPEGKDLKCLNLYAWYAKVDGKLYGVIKTVWRYWEPQYSEHLQRDYYLGYYDDSYILYDMTESTVTDISRDDLLNIVGIRNVYSFEYGKYGEGIEIPMC